MKDRLKTKSRRVTPWTGIHDATPMQAFIEECTRIEYESKHPTLKGSPEVALINSFEPGGCGHCGGDRFVRRGFTSNGIQRYRCIGCGRTFNVLTGTVFDSHRLPLTEWLGFLLDIFGFGSFSLTSKGNRNSINTTRYWKDKVFLLLEGSQDSTMLGGTVWIDEKFYTVRAPDIRRRPDGTLYNGLSRNQMCIGVGCDDKGHVLCILEGVGKPGNKGNLEAFANHIRPGSRLIHDKERSDADALRCDEGGGESLHSLCCLIRLSLHIWFSTKTTLFFGFCGILSTNDRYNLLFLWKTKDLFFGHGFGASSTLALFWLSSPIVPRSFDMLSSFACGFSSIWIPRTTHVLIGCSQDQASEPLLSRMAGLRWSTV